jgi:hypothetical protein
VLWCATTCCYELMMCELLRFVIMYCNRYWPPTSPLPAFVVVVNCCLVMYSPPSTIPPLHVYVSKLEVFELGFNPKLLFWGGNKFHEVFSWFFFHHNFEIIHEYFIGNSCFVSCFFHFFHSLILFHFFSMFYMYIFLKYYSYKILNSKWNFFLSAWFVIWPTTFDIALYEKKMTCYFCTMVRIKRY